MILIHLKKIFYLKYIKKCIKMSSNDIIVNKILNNRADNFREKKT